MVDKNLINLTMMTMTTILMTIPWVPVIIHHTNTILVTFIITSIRIKDWRKNHQHLRHNFRSFQHIIITHSSYTVHLIWANIHESSLFRLLCNILKHYWKEQRLNFLAGVNVPSTLHLHISHELIIVNRFRKNDRNQWSQLLRIQNCISVFQS